MSALSCEYSGYVISRASGVEAKSSCEVTVVTGVSVMTGQQPLDRAL
jgi:hypothetical protein